ncbi:MAG TPA: MlaD family protein, partial [Thermoanaerobaculia bacterium]|nr:MlaD family protein [Thermoanaerobaculia bacterium]
MTAAAKVGIFMLIVLVIAGYFIIRIEDIILGGGGERKEVRALFDSVAGLDEGSPVRIAGVRVGKVSRISLTSDGNALVTMELDPEVDLHRGASAQIAELGLLGDKYVELFPGETSGPILQVEQPDVVIPGRKTATIGEVT